MRTPLLALALFLALAAPASALTEIHAHRGGPIVAGAPFSPEDSQPAFDFAHSNGADWIELDAKLSSDGVAVIIHDATLDRTTDCTGQVAQRTAAQLAECHVDIVGTDSNVKPVPGSAVAIPRLDQVLDWAKAADARLNLEIKNQPTDPDYDNTPGFATKVVQTVMASGLPLDHILIQSFWPPNLDVAEAAGLRTSLLTLANSSNGSIEVAQAKGYDVLSPAWPIPQAADYVRRAHAANKQVVPYTFNKEEEVVNAVDAGVDAVIANDVIVAQRVIHGIDCPAARLREAKLRASLVKARATRARARSAASRARANASVKRANTRRQTAKRARLRVCTPGPR
jgi:glycerophosphoryl diester phosphodiesterase